MQRVHSYDPVRACFTCPYWADLLFTIIFTLEMVMKLIAYGLYFGEPDAYLRDAWNCMVRCDT
jgi:hypothetical protein